MCVTLGNAHLSQTTLYVGVSGEFHVCGYQNKVQNLTSRLQLGKTGGNAMILPFPAVLGTMSQKNFLTGMDACPHVLQDMALVVSPPESKSFSFSLDIERSMDVEIFELDIYTVVLAQKAGFIPDVIGDVPKEKRPPLKPDIFMAYDIWYPDWPIAICCFNNQEAALANPLMVYYEPSRPEFLFAPALDSHTGYVPDLKSEVLVDHTVVVGTPDGKGEVVRYQDQIPSHIKRYLPRSVIGAKVHTHLPNGDFVFRTQQVEKGVFNPMRLLPPGAPRK